MLTCSALAACGSGPAAPASSAEASPGAQSSASAGPPAVVLNPEQLRLIAIDTVGTAEFGNVDSAVGTVDFDQTSAVQVFSPYQGRIVMAGPQLGEAVHKGQVLFTVESPDLMAASAGLISAAANEVAARKALDRAEALHKTQGFSDQALEQAVQAEASANAALQQARLQVAVFGKGQGQIGAMIAHRRVDGALAVLSPIDGIVTARNAQPGLLVQPGNAPAPFAVARPGRMWVLANASETDATHFHPGQPVDIHIDALGNAVLAGRIETVAASVDPNTHTVQLRASLSDPQHQLRAGELASFAIHTGASVRAVALPAEGVVREGDGTLTVWVTRDRHHFTQREVTVGLTRDGLDQITSGLQPGELAVTKGAVYLDNMLSAVPDD